MMLLVAVGCKEDEPEVVEPILPALELSRNSIRFEWEGGAEDIQVSGADKWDVRSESPAWLQIHVTDVGLSLSASINEGVRQRTHEIVVASDQDERVLAVIQSAKAFLEFEGEKRDTLSAGEAVHEVGVRSNVRFKVNMLDGGDGWIRQSDKGGDGMISNKVISDVKALRFDISQNDSGEERNARIVISASQEELADTLHLTQLASGQQDDEVPENDDDQGYDEGENEDGGNGWYADGDVFVLQFSEKAGAQLVFMGDGFIHKDLNVNGKYEESIKEAVEHFFSIEPYSTYSDYFNVYMVIAESENEGVGSKGSLGGSFQTRFGSSYGTGTEIRCNEDVVFEYARKPESISDDDQVTAIVVLNSDKYAGTAYLYEDGNSIALCPMSEEEYPYDFRGIVQHEAGGHAFGYLADEYVYYDQQMPKSRIEYMLEMRDRGFYINLDFTDDEEEVLWSGFIGREGYEMVGLYEGGYEYQYGVWRSEDNSCMNNNIPYFNAQSRWAIYSRMMNLSGQEPDFEEFVGNDSPESGQAHALRYHALPSSEEFIHLHPPVIKASRK